MDEKAARNSRNKARQAQLDRDDFVKAACGTKQGREYLAWIMGLGRPNENPYAGNALATSFRCGEANVSKQIERHILLAAPKGYFQILEDQQKEALNDHDAPTGSSGASDSTFRTVGDPGSGSGDDTSGNTGSAFD